jgi:hypothetical protein
MSAKTTAAKPASDLISKYRPLGLKAVLAAALQLKTGRLSPKKSVA